MGCVLRKGEKEALKERKEQHNRVSVEETLINEETKYKSIEKKTKKKIFSQLRNMPLCSDLRGLVILKQNYRKQRA